MSKEEVIAKTDVREICLICGKHIEAVGIGINECNNCKMLWFEKGTIISEQHRDQYKKTEEILAEIERKKQVEQEKAKKDDKKEEKKDDKKKLFQRPHKLEGSTVEMESGCGNLFLTINHTEDKRIVEVLLVANPPGGCGAAFLNTVGITLSFYLQEGGDVKRYIRKLMGTRCPRARPSAKSCPEAIIQALKEEMAYLKGEVVKEGTVKLLEKPATEDVMLVRGELCPECNNLLVMESGCKACKNCGWSECV